MSTFFKFSIDGILLDTFDDTYFELKKGTIIGKKPNMVHKEWSSNISLPASSKNVEIFKAHSLLGGDTSIMSGIVHFSNRSLWVDVQLVDFDDNKITVYVIEKVALTSMDERTATIKDIGEAQIYWRNAFFYDRSKLSNPDVPNMLRTYFSLETLASVKDGGIEQGQVPLSDIDTNIGLRYDLGGVSMPTLRLQKKAVGDVPIDFSSASIIMNMDGSILTPSNFTPPVVPGIVWSSSSTRIYCRRDPAYLPKKGRSSHVRFVWRALRIRGTGTLYPSINATSVDGTVLRTIQITSPNGVFEIGLILPAAGNGIYWSFVNNTSQSWQLQMIAVGFVDITDKADASLINFTPAVEVMPEVTIDKLMIDYANRLGKYPKISGDKIIFSDLPTLRNFTLSNLRDNFAKFRKTTTKRSGVLTAVNNIIAFAEVDKWSNSLNVVISDNQLGTKLEPTADFLRFVFGESSKSLIAEDYKTATPILVGDGLFNPGQVDRFRIYRDLFNNVAEYELEFKHLSETPESIIYIPQLNGLFLAKEIISTTTDKIILRCFKITREQGARK